MRAHRPADGASRSEVLELPNPGRNKPSEAVQRRACRGPRMCSGGCQSGGSWKAVGADLHIAPLRASGPDRVALRMPHMLDTPRSCRTGSSGVLSMYQRRAGPLIAPGSSRPLRRGPRSAPAATRCRACGTCCEGASRRPSPTGTGPGRCRCSTCRSPRESPSARRSRVRAPPSPARAGTRRRPARAPRHVQSDVLLATGRSKCLAHHAQDELALELGATPASKSRLR